MATEVFADRRGIEEGIAAIATDDKRGASEVARRALAVMRKARPRPGASPAQYTEAVKGLARRIARSRPAMAPVGAVMARLICHYQHGDGAADSGEAAYHRLRRSIEGVRRQIEEANESAKSHYLKRFSSVRHPMIISYSSQVIRTLQSRPSLYVTVCESRPALEGRRAAKRLAECVRKVTVITEAQMMLAMERCDAAVLGADCLRADGAVFNKAGSHLLALAARTKKKPVVVLADTSKLVGRNQVPNESHSLEEVWRKPPRGVEVVNVYFEFVPSRLIDWVVTEEGVHEPRELRLLHRRQRKYRDALAPRRR